MSSTSTSSISSASTSTSSDWWCGGSGQAKWLTDVVAGGKSNDWLMRWYGNALCPSTSASSISSASTSTSSDWWCGGSGQVKWLTDVVAGGKSNDWLMWWQWASQMTDDVVAGGKSNDWLMWWYGNALCLALAWALSLVLVLGLTGDVVAVGKSSEVKWLTDVVAGGKSNDWLMQWYSNALYLALVPSLSLVLALTDDVVAVGKSNDWLMWWQWASQMTDWCSGTVMLYV